MNEAGKTRGSGSDSSRESAANQGRCREAVRGPGETQPAPLSGIGGALRAWKDRGRPVLRARKRLSVEVVGALFLAAGALAFSACASGPRPAPGAMPEDFYRWIESKSASTHGWAVLLPGASGLTVFGDSLHYVYAAEHLGECGFDVLLVDYKPAYFASANAPEVPTGEKIAWVTSQAIEWMYRAHPETRELPGHLIGWSLGAEGVLRLIGDANFVQERKLVSACLYYPSNQKKLRLANRVPLLVMTGDADNVTKVRDVRRLVDERESGTEAAELVVYPKAHHGFDIASLVEKKTIRMLPLIGPKATLQYAAAAANDASQRLCTWLTKKNPVEQEP